MDEWEENPNRELERKPNKQQRRRLRRGEAAHYLQEVHGIPLSEKTLANRNAAGLEPRPEYLGTIPFYRPEALDAWAERAFTPESPVAVTRRRARQLQNERRTKRSSEAV
jgi:hypothetical protein